MERRTIGAPALAVGAVGLGCMPMNWAYSTSRQRGDESLRAVHRALDLGCSLLDTADMYGPFTNELLLGRVLKERRADAFVSTKVGLLVGDQHIVANGRPGYVKRACDASLRRLQTDVIDLYQLHRADPEVPVEETWGAMAELVRAGKVRALGLCAVGARSARRTGTGLHDATIRQLERVQQVFPVSAVEAELSVWSPEALWALLPWCAARGVGFLAAMPLGNGFLTGTLRPGEGFEPDDPRARHPRFTAEMMAANQPIVAGLRRIAARHGEGVTPAAVALAWVLAQGPHVVPVPGTKQERWVTQNAGAARLRLTPGDLAEVAALPRALGSWE
ncbi:aldo/keto reductase [Streptomyces griseoviridis]|uniref:Aryl-alcohol dehydrogenase-like predicted oxidoreductase n=3 Tax=Streptomyces TaxID=1883 RepID=A0ABT9LKN9_STRGD|nr:MULTISPECIES: aldo/keto reductase [Streptomyces]MDP9684244.1 aryl-alcohol dehydrogenase-like predicted oxidoreductase [Streptomyces griseoviridis]GGS59705.1 oxidoreductase [Streptomyces niveoruber]GGT01990.1 oxidoreductase [Streptomyces griseoviridis]GGU39272.1 oxidoreductase [Streptomyces daghestanicus]GHI30798.1 oxidoreductase [Streptomyces daghestanicus]